MPTSIVTTRGVLLSSTLELGTGKCPGCMFCGGSDGQLTFEPALKKKAARMVAGDWKNAIFERTPTAQDPVENAINKRNVNDFLKHVPVGIISKGTEFFHVTASSDWVTKSMVGGPTQDEYSFFTLRAKGFAAAHANQFAARIQLRVSQDVDVFFFGNYGFEFWRLFTAEFHGGRTQLQIEKGATRVGGEVVATIKNSWPGKYRPVAWMGCSECEIVVHNAVIPLIMETTAIATSNDNFKSRKIVPIGSLPAAPSSKVKEVGIAPPPWMGPGQYSDAKVREAETLLAGRQWPADPAVFS